MHISKKEPLLVANKENLLMNVNSAIQTATWPVRAIVKFIVILLMGKARNYLRFTSMHASRADHVDHCRVVQYGASRRLLRNFSSTKAEIPSGTTLSRELINVLQVAINEGESTTGIIILVQCPAQHSKHIVQPLSPLGQNRKINSIISSSSWKGAGVWPDSTRIRALRRTSPSVRAEERERGRGTINY